MRRSGDDHALHRIDVATTRRSRTLEPTGTALARWTALYGDLRATVCRWSGQPCPEGLAVLLRGEVADIVGWPAEHCDHWPGDPDLAVAHPAPDLEQLVASADPPGCCPHHRVDHLMAEHGLPVPSVRGHFDCDDDS